MDHSLFFREWTWDGRGEYIDHVRRSILFEGVVNTFHEGDLWYHAGRMTLTPREGAPVSFENRYEIVPFKIGKPETTWMSLNLDLGILNGRFVVVERAILSFCRSENGLFTGYETFVQVDRDRYETWGTLFREKERISSWTLKLIRKG